MEFLIYGFCVACWWLFEPKPVACIYLKKQSFGSDCVINKHW
jgi:hypothetical protein